MKKILLSLIFTALLSGGTGLFVLPQQVKAQAGGYGDFGNIYTSETAETDAEYTYIADLYRADNQKSGIVYGPRMQRAASTNPALSTQIKDSAVDAQKKLDTANTAFQKYNTTYSEYKSAVANGDTAKATAAQAELSTLKQDYIDASYAYDQTIDPVIRNIENDPIASDVYKKDQDTAGESCSIGNLSRCFLDFTQSLFAGLGEMALTVSGLLVYLGALIMDLGIKFSIEDFRNIVTSTSGIRDAWVVLRDFANMFFIFMLLYAAIKTVLGQNSKEIIKNVIIAALIINFSFFITSLFIDASNTLTVGLYKQAVGNSPSISAAVMESLKLQSVFDSAGLQSLVGKPDALLTIAKIGIMGSIFFLVSAFVFFAAGILFLLRGITFIVLLILSPLAFAAGGLPRDEISGKWWKALINNVIFAPMYMIMILISLKVATSVTGVNNVAGTEPKTLAAAFTQSNGGEPVLNFIIIIALMVMSLVIAKDLGASGSGTVMKWGKSLRSYGQGLAGGATLGTLGALGRGTVGRGAAAMADSEALKERAAKKGISGAFARLQLKTARGAAGASFDARATGAAKNLGLGSARGVGGYSKYQEEKVKEATAFAKSLGPSDEAKDAASQNTATAQSALKLAEGRAAENTGVKTLDTLVTKRDTEIKARKAKIEAMKKKEADSTTSATDKMKAQKMRVQTEQEVTKLENEQARAKEMRKKIIERETKAFRDEATKAAQAEKDIKDAGKNRQEAYAETYETGSPLNRAFFVGKTKSTRRKQAAAIRKQAKGKSKEDKARDLLKEFAEEDGSKTAAPTTSGGAGSGSSSAGTPASGSSTTGGTP